MCSVTLAVPGDAELQDHTAKVLHDAKCVFAGEESVSEPARNPSIVSSESQKLLALSSTGMQHALHSSIAAN